MDAYQMFDRIYNFLTSHGGRYVMPRELVKLSVQLNHLDYDVDWLQPVIVYGVQKIKVKTLIGLYSALVPGNHDDDLDICSIYKHMKALGLLDTDTGHNLF